MIKPLILIIYTPLLFMVCSTNITEGVVILNVMYSDFVSYLMHQSHLPYQYTSWENAFHAMHQLMGQRSSEPLTLTNACHGTA